MVNGDARLNAEQMARALGGAKRGSNGWWGCKCPAHQDGKASLTLHDTNDGRIAYRCMAGCDKRTVGEALRAQGLLPERRHKANSNQKKSRGRIVAIYDYCNETSALLYQVVRFDPKDFRQRRPDPDKPGKFTWSLDGVRRVLYHLPELVAADPAKAVLVAEGEKDVDNLRALGFVATTSAQGADHWTLTDRDVLVGRPIVVIPDNDAAGRKYRDIVGRDMHGKAASVRVLELPNLSPKGDVSDWIAAGGTAEELRRLAAEAPEYVPGGEPEPEPERQPASGTTGGDTREAVRLSPEWINANTRKCAAILSDALYMHGAIPSVLVRVEDLDRGQEAEVGEPEPGIVLGGIRHARGTLIFAEPSPERLLYLLDERLVFERFERTREKWVRTSCPPAIAKRVIGAASEVGLRSCAGIVTVPLFVNGEIVSTPGYHPGRRVFLDVPAEPPIVPEHPTKADALRALNVLLAPFTGYIDGLDEQDAKRLTCSTAAAELTAILRPSLPHAPAILIDAEVPGAGKGKYARALSVIATGRLPSIVTEGHSEEEVEKRMAAAILTGSAAIMVDNLQRTLASSTLESGLTEGYATIRIFGKLTEVTVPCSAFVVVTANNATIRADMLRRTLPVRIVAGTDKPETRMFPFDPYQVAVRRRAEIVVAGLTIAKAWWLARDTEDGRRIRKTTLGSFERWADLVAGAVEWLTGMNPVKLIEDRKAEDPARNAEWQVITALYELFGEREWTAKEAVGEPAKVDSRDGYVIKEATGLDPDIWASVIPLKGPRPSPLQVGQWLNKRKDRVWTDLQLVSTPDAHKHVVRWRIVDLRGLRVSARVNPTPNANEKTQTDRGWNHTRKPSQPSQPGPHRDGSYDNCGSCRQIRGLNEQGLCTDCADATNRDTGLDA